MEILINTVTFALPVRRFLVDYAVTKQQQLPVVKEFVVRFIFTLRECHPDAIQHFFGMSSKELYTVLSNLREERLIVWEHDQIKLSQYALSRFESVGNSFAPRFFEIADQMDSVTFELLSYKMISDIPEGRWYPGNVELKLDSESYKGTANKAAGAFDQKFSSFLERIKGIDTYTDHRTLYKINSITPKMDQQLPIHANFFAELPDLRRPIMEYADEWVEEWDDDQTIKAAINESLSSSARLQLPKQSESLKEYLHSTFDPYLSDCLSREGLDLNRVILASHDKSDAKEKTHMLFGNLYTPDNSALIFKLLDEQESQLDENDHRRKLNANGIIWTLSQDEKLWGRSREFSDMIEGLNDRLDGRKAPGRVVLGLQVNSLQEARQVQDFYNFSKPEFQGVVSPFVNKDTELLLIPDCLVACLFHIKRADFGSLTIPVGYVSTDPKYVRAVQSKVKNWIADDRSFNTYLRRGSSKEEFNNFIIAKVL